MKVADTEVGTKFNIVNGGVATILKYNKWDDVLVELSHNQQRIVRMDYLRIGNIKDKMIPSVLGIGFLGNGKHKTRVKGKSTQAYEAWSHMLSRCYSKKYQLKFPTYKGCTVCEEWHNFQNFAEWFDKHYITGMHLDKDIKVSGNKMYSPRTCKFVSCAENTIKAHAGSFKFKRCDGVVVSVYNLAKFCRERNLSQGNMSMVNSGERKSHKGWTRAH